MTIGLLIVAGLIVYANIGIYYAAWRSQSWELYISDLDESPRPLYPTLLWPFFFALMPGKYLSKLTTWIRTPAEENDAMYEDQPEAEDPDDDLE